MRKSLISHVTLRHVVILLMLSVSLTGCRACSKTWNKLFGRHVVAEEPPATAAITDLGPTAPVPVGPVGPDADVGRPGVPPVPSQDLERVHFDYDSAVLTPAAQQILDRNTQWLTGNPNVRVQIEGHCDERGTEEYNLALGERRANSVKNYLTTNGINAERLFTISYGESQPIDPGHGESAWWKNRRAEFKVIP